MEELKLIMETLQGLGDNATNAFIIWMLIKYLVSYLITGAVVYGILYTIYKLFIPLVHTNVFISRIINVMGFYCSDEGLSRIEKNQIIDILSNYRKTNDNKE